MIFIHGVRKIERKRRERDIERHGYRNRQIRDIQRNKERNRETEKGYTCRESRG